MNRRTVFGLAILAIASCTEATGPIDPVWGKQPCASCGMLVSDRGYAAEVLAPDGRRSFFDDPGCLVQYLADRKMTPSGAWVRDAHGERWLDARAARYARGARTPMDFGFEARADEGISYDAFTTEILEKQKGARP